MAEVSFVHRFFCPHGKTHIARFEEAQIGCRVFFKYALTHADIVFFNNPAKILCRVSEIRRFECSHRNRYVGIERERRTFVFGQNCATLIDTARYVARNAETRGFIDRIDESGNVGLERSVKTGTV